MSRPFRLLLPAACAALSLGFSACVGTVYDKMYSNRKNYYKPPEEKKEVSAEELFGADKPATPTDPGAALPALGGDIPGLPPAMPADPAGMPALPPPPPAM